MNIVEALKTVAEKCPNGYAAAYAAAALRMNLSDEDLRMQLLYVKTNLSHWRGPLAQEVRATINESLS